MGTKNNPGPYDCYAHAEPDEPIFVLRGKDPAAHIVVAFWAALSKQLHNQTQEKMMEAAKIAAEMRLWAESKGKKELVDTARALVEDDVATMDNILDDVAIIIREEAQKV
jgi:hypothetical protein